MKAYAVLAISLLFLLAFSSIAQAQIGVSPGRYIVDFKPGLKTTLQFEFYQDRDTDMQISAQGDLAQYAKLSKTRIGKSGVVDVTLSLPQSIEVPGTHTIYIAAKQMIGEGQGFGIGGNIQGLIHVVVPYPGQYATITVTPTNANVGEAVNLSTRIENLGAEAVDAAAAIEIYNNETYITMIDLGSFRMNSPDLKNFQSTLNSADYPAGIYTAKGILSYGDNKIANSSSTFRLGELSVRIVNHSNFLQRDKINRFDIDVASDWNGRIDNVYADVALEGYPISFLTPTTSLDNFGTAKLSGFFDTTGIQNDTFNARIKVHYAGKSTEQVVTLKFAKKTDYMMIGIIAAIAAVIALIAIVTFLLKRVKKDARRRN